MKLTAFWMLLFILCAACCADQIRATDNRQKPGKPASTALQQQEHSSDLKSENQKYSHADVQIVNPPQKDFYDKAPVWISVLLALVAIGTLWVIQKQTHHIVTSERAWVVSQIENEWIPPEINGDMGVRWTRYEVRVVNKGKTPAYLLESGYHSVILPSVQSLPVMPEPYEQKEITRWEEKGLPLQPGADILKSFLGTWCKDAGKLQHGFDVLWVYGYVVYRDAFKKRRETRYCFRWNHGIGTDHGSSWDPGGPSEYNKAT